MYSSIPPHACKINQAALRVVLAGIAFLKTLHFLELQSVGKHSLGALPF
jgi:hypothetical protein